MTSRPLQAVGRIRLGWIVAALAVLVGTVAIAFQLSGPPSEPVGGATQKSSPLSGQVDPGPGRDFMAIFDEKQPLFDPGTETSLGQASSLAKMTVYEPQAVSGSTPETWVNPETQEVGLRYGTGLVVYEVPWPLSADDPATTYDRQAKQWQAGYTGRISGHPAWVIPEDSRAPGEPPVSVVHVNIDGVDVTVYAKASIDEAVAIAESLQPVASG